MPYRVDIPNAGSAVVDRLIELGALDAESRPDGAIAALMPDSVPPDQVAGAIGISDVTVSPAVGRDADSVWILSPRPVQVGRLRILPSTAPAEPGAIRLTDAAAFGTGFHPTTALCLEAVEQLVPVWVPQRVLDVGTGSGVLALAALVTGVPHALGIDLDEDALRVAAENARLNGVQERLALTRGGPDTIDGAWPLILANVLAGPLIEMAPALVRRVAPQGHVVLSGIPAAVEPEVAGTYRRLGMRPVSSSSRGGWCGVVLQASW